MSSDTNTSQQYTFDYDSREKAFIDYARSMGYKEGTEFDTYSFECKVLRSLDFNIWENLKGRATAQEDITKKIRIVRHRSRDNQLPELIENSLNSLEGKVIELGEFALKMYDLKDDNPYFKINCFSDLPHSERSHEIICEYSIRNTGQRGRVFVYCEEEA